jgi:hypothetical protein
MRDERACFVAIALQIPLRKFPQHGKINKTKAPSFPDMGAFA